MSKSLIEAPAQKFIKDLEPQLPLAEDQILEAWGPVKTIDRDSYGTPARQSLTVLASLA